MNASTALVRVAVRKGSPAGLAAFRRRMIEAALDGAVAAPRVWLEALEPRRMMSVTPAFDNHGTSVAWLPASLNVPTTEVVPSAVALDAGGKLLVAGILGRLTGPGTSETFEDLFVARVNGDGSPDHSFGQDGGGFAVLHVGEALDDVDVVPLPDGKFIVIGSAWLETFVARFDGDGSLDATYNGGMARYDAFLGSVFPQVASDGSLSLVALASPDLMLARGGGLDAMVTLHLTPDGHSDPAFGTGGYAITDLPPEPILTDNSVPMLTSAVATPEGGASLFYLEMPDRFANVRDDLAFSLRHVVVDAQGDVIVADQILPDLPSERPDGSGFGYEVAAMPDGSAFVGGGVDGNRIEKLDAAGRLDPTFGDGGIATVGARYADVQDVDDRGRLIVVTKSDSYWDSTYLRLNADGSVDPTFASWRVADDVYGPDLLLPGGQLLLASEISSDGGLRAGFAVYTRPTDAGTDDPQTPAVVLEGDPAAMTSTVLLAQAPGTQGKFLFSADAATLLKQDGDAVLDRSSPTN